MTLPYPGYLRRIVLNSVLVWVTLRLLMALTLWRAGDPASAIDPGWSTGVLLIFVTGVVIWLDGLRSHELVLTANLGVAASTIVGASLATATVFEVAAQLLIGAA